MAEIINFYEPTLRYPYALGLIKQGQVKEAALVLEEIKDKDLKILLALLDCYEILKAPFFKCKNLERIIALKPEKIYFKALIHEYKKMKISSKALKYSNLGMEQYPHDPDFKKEILEILLQNEKYQAALKFLKKNKHALCLEKYLFYTGYLNRENGHRIKALLSFRRMVKKYPYNVLYRYMLSSVYQSLGLHKKSAEQMSFIRDFLKQMPTLSLSNQSDSDFAYIMQNMMAAMK